MATTNNIQKIAVLGSTGTQGSAVIRALMHNRRCQVRVQTCNPDHLSAQELAQLPNVSFHVGHIKSKELLHEAMQGMDTVFFLGNSDTIREKANLHWSIHAFKLACELGIKLFQFSSLDYMPNKSGYYPKFCCTHYNTKGQVSEWIKQQLLSPMKWAILTSGPYMEMMYFIYAPKFNQATSTYQFQAPLGQSSAILMIHLNNQGKYTHWVFDHPDESAGHDLKIAMAHISFDEAACAFTKTTGLKAWLDCFTKESNSSTSQVKVSSKSGVLKWHQSFSSWWNLYCHSGGDHPLITRDYELLDKILPNRVWSIEEWMKKVNYTGVPKVVLKDHQDKAGSAGPAAAAQ